MKGVLFTHKKLAVVAGFNWRDLTSYPKGKDKQVMEAARRYGANRVIVHAVDTGQGVHAKVGCYSFSDTHDVKPKEIHSAATLLVQTHPDIPQMILAWRVKENQIAVIVIQDSVPVLDEVFDDANALNTINKSLNGEFSGFTGHVVFTNDQDFYNNSEVISADDLARNIGKSTKLKSPPVDPVKAIAVPLVVLLVAGGGFMLHKIHQDREKAKRIAAEKKLDPIPGYQALLQSKINQMGYDRYSILRTIEQVKKYPVWQNGWLLSEINCEGENCVSVFTRMGGTTRELLMMRSGEDRLPSSTADKVELRWNSGFTPAGVGSFEKAMEKTLALSFNENVYQKWRNANIVVKESQSDPFKTWPTPVEGDISRLPPEMTLKARAVSFDAPGPLAEEIIGTVPPSVYWTGFTLKVSLTDKSKLTMYNLRGVTYVR